MIRLRVVPAFLVMAVVSLSAAPAFAQSCVGSQPAVCPLGQPSGTTDCVIVSSCTVTPVEPYPVIDFGARRLVIQKIVTVGGVGILRVAAAEIWLGASGRIVALGAGQGAQSVELNSAGELTVESGGLIDVSSAKGTLQVPGSAGSIVLQGAAVRIDGRLSATGDTRDTYGGSIEIASEGDLGVGVLEVRGGDRAGGGDVTLYAGGTITASGEIKAYGGDGGTVSFDATGDLVAASSIQVQATASDGGAGSVDAFAGGSATFGGAVSGWGLEGVHEDGRADTGGDGADFSVEAIAGSITINGNLSLYGAPSGSGGDLELDAAGNVTIAGKVQLGTSGASGSGSIGTSVLAGGDIVISKEIDASSLGSGGELLFSAAGNLVVTSTGRIKVDGATSQTSGGGAGFMTLEGACLVDIASGAILSAKGYGSFPYGSIELRGSHVRIGGRLDAGSANALVYRTIQLLGTAVLLPAAALPPADPASAPCCGGCPTTTTTTLPPPTTTSTTLPPTTTTSTTLPPTTTSTTLPPTTTTSTTLPPTTTTTSPPTTTTSSTTTTTLPPTTTTTSPPTTTTSTSTSTSSSSSTIDPTTTTTSTSATSSTSTTQVTTTTVSSTSLATSTTETVTTSTTSTTEPPPGAECLGQASTLDAADCLIGTLSDAVRGTPADVLGGKATARRLSGFLGRADRFLASAGRGEKVQANLRRARRELKGFEKAVRRGLGRKRTPIDPAVGELMLGLVTDAGNDVGRLQATLQ